MKKVTNSKMVCFCGNIKREQEPACADCLLAVAADKRLQSTSNVPVTPQERAERLKVLQVRQAQEIRLRKRLMREQAETKKMIKKQRRHRASKQTTNTL